MISAYVIVVSVFGLVFSYLWLIHHFWLCHVFKQDQKPTVQKRIVILGGGFGGVYSALHFDKTFAADPTVEVTLVSRENFVLFTPMLHEVAAGDLELSDRLPVKKEKGRIAVNEMLEVAGCPGVWAVGDCASIPNTSTGKLHPPTAQHALREAVCCAKNVVAAIRGSKKAPFRFTTMGQLATIGHHAGVAEIFGLRLSGFPAWWLWRTIYLAKLPTFAKKLRVALRWTLDFAFPRDLAQHVTLHSIDRVSQLVAYVRQHPVTPQPATTPSKRHDDIIAGNARALAQR